MFELVPRAALASSDRTTAVPAALALSELSRWLRDPPSRRALCDAFEALSGDRATRLGDREVEARLERALRSGELLGFARDRRRVVIESEPLEVLGPEVDGPAPETTWISIALADEQGKPVAARFRVHLPDGSVREGKLPKSGETRLEGIVPGTCQVEFPDFDATEWRAA